MKRRAEMWRHKKAWCDDDILDHDAADDDNKDDESINKLHINYTSPPKTH